MTWFRVDDHLHAHPKAMRAGTEAMGLWCLAGSWSGDQLTDGWVPEFAALRLAPNAEELAGRLVRAGLWIEQVREGERGWQFHEWTEQQPTRDHVLGEREKARKRMAEGRERRRLEREAEAERGRRVPENTPPGSESVRANTTGTFGDGSPSPTRPDPTRPELPTDVPSPPSGRESGGDAPRKSATDPKGTRLSEEWQPTAEDRDWFRRECPDLVGRGNQLTDEFRDYWLSRAGKEARKTDWSRTWRNWMRRRQGEAPDRGPGARSAAAPRANRTTSTIAGLQARKSGRSDHPPMRALPGGQA